jgi:putative ABC transport system permease protein
MAKLKLRTAARIAMREMRHSRGKFAFVVLSVAIGVAALTGVRGFSASFRSMLTLRARSIMAGDVAARMNATPTPKEQAGLDALARSGNAETQVVELSSMASTPTSFDPLLVSIKAVDPTAYPFYGDVDLSPQMSLKTALTPATVAVGNDLLVRLKLNVGESVKIGNGLYRIVAVVNNEPDRLSGAFAAGPRVLMSDDALKDSGLLAYGSHATRRYIFKLPASQPGVARSDKEVDAFKATLEALLPDAQITSYREANPALAQGLDNATGLLSLMSLVALVLGAVGVAMAMRAHLQQRLDTIAILKSLGAGSTQVMKIYLLQTLVLGLGGGLLGVLLGVGVQLAFPLFLAKLLHITPDFRFDVRSALVGLGAGLLTTLLFTLPPLLDVRNVKPILILRRAVESMDDPFVERLRRKLRSSAVQLAASVLIVAGLGGLAVAVSDSARVGIIFAIGLVVVLLVLLAMSAATLWLLRRFVRSNRQVPASVRHGLANLYRPGNPSAALLAALGLGIMQIMTVYLVQREAVDEFHMTTEARLPNLFLIDIAPDEVNGVRSLLMSQPGVRGEPELIPIAASRLIAVNGVPAAQLQKQITAPRAEGPRGAFRTLNLTWSPSEDAPPPGSKVTAGRWWSAAEGAAAKAHPQIAVGEEAARRLHLKPGDAVTLAAQDSEVTAHVAAVFSTDSQHTYSRAEFVVPKAQLQGMAVIWYGGVHCEPKATAALERAMYQSYPTITVINVAATLEVVRQVILQITYIIQFLAAFSIFAGIVILASAIAGTRYRRVREVVVLKTLGATRRRIATIFSVEFAVLGLVAGLVGVVFANIVSRETLVHALKIDYHLHLGLSVFALLLTMLLTVGAGWAVSWRVLGQKPLEVLREE